ncbi:complex I NDUFA9 subunit family protein [Acetobacter orleanensis]|uniref:3-beta-hydroxy-Delta(5)-steroid dehydrogenase n=1 Tax=Acetobacter orleanensis TaxID=104099 RepID=A0A4Y3TLN8_9PROT|nr:complex I NDUFA9 subunit family protein [Acetobacter orleanensis]KXV62588.1 3-beta hydroxysteroid dehydrogenase [Acetobacter orleanensis]PCD79965.1 complex I NDUFA9 subunit family protein [Acetobacter orleanensis]GAN68275.1 NADH dehydrogenase [Acetobacter orleanensis JCM 7639]GBR31167.1 NADH-ubiquinone oxidoreductase 39 kDa subunit [Acetobacter orleanensis NRIC 0473]GEB82832.1 3-beta-hydroxy-Delta(5)-steroid dehydrogenase [Acetobacter orleanensis]
MSEQKVATVFGGGGFVGRYVVQRLAEAGYRVRIACRRPDKAAVLRVLGDVGQIAPFYASVLDDASVACVVENASVVVNLAAVLGDGSGQGLEAVNVEGAGRVARLSAQAGVPTFIQMSALGASPTAPSAYGRSRAAGEGAVRAAIPQASIVRPSVIFGPEDQFFNMFAMLARYLPVLPVYGATTRLQPVYVGDVAQVVGRLADEPALAGREWALGGPDSLTMKQIYEWVLQTTQRSRPLFVVPPVLARMQAAIFERLPGHILTRDQLLMLSQDNVVPAGQCGFAELGIMPQSIESVVPFYLARYRVGGGRSGIRVEK